MRLHASEARHLAGLAFAVASERTFSSGRDARMRSRLASRSMTGAQKGQNHTGGTSRSGGLTQLQ